MNESFGKAEGTFPSSPAATSSPTGLQHTHDDAQIACAVTSLEQPPAQIKNELLCILPVPFISNVGIAPHRGFHHSPPPPSNEWGAAER